MALLGKLLKAGGTTAIGGAAVGGVTGTVRGAQALLGGVGAFARAIDNTTGGMSFAGSDVDSYDSNQKTFEKPQTSSKNKSTEPDLPDKMPSKKRGGFKPVDLKLPKDADRLTSEDVISAFDRLNTAVVHNLNVINHNLIDGLDFLFKTVKVQETRVKKTIDTVDNIAAKVKYLSREQNKIQYALKELSVTGGKKKLGKGQIVDEAEQVQQDLQQQQQQREQQAQPNSGNVIGDLATSYLAGKGITGVGKKILGIGGKTAAEGAAAASAGSVAAGGLKGAAKKIPLVGGLVTGGLEYLDSGDLGKSAVVGAGAAAGAVVGGALGLPFGGVGAIGGGIAGGMAGESLARSGYEWMFGKSKDARDSSDDASNKEITLNSEKDISIISKQDIEIKSTQDITISGRKITLTGEQIILDSQDIRGYKGPAQASKNDHEGESDDPNDFEANKPKGFWRSVGEGLGLVSRQTPDGDTIPGIGGRLLGQQVQPGSSVTRGMKDERGNIIDSATMTKMEELGRKGDIAGLQALTAERGYRASGPWCGRFAAMYSQSAGFDAPKGSSIATNWHGWGEGMKGEDINKEGRPLGSMVGTYYHGTYGGKQGKRLGVGETGGHVMQAVPGSYQKDDKGKESAVFIDQHGARRRSLDDVNLRYATDDAVAKRTEKLQERQQPTYATTSPKEQATATGKTTQTIQQPSAAPLSTSGNYPSKTEGTIFDPNVKIDRSTIKAQLQDPNILARMTAIGIQEVGTNNPLKLQAWVETVANRALASGKGVEAELNARYYARFAGIPAALEKMKNDPTHFRSVALAAGLVAEGSNVSRGATDNASAHVAANAIAKGNIGQWWGTPGKGGEWMGTKMGTRGDPNWYAKLSKFVQQGIITPTQAAALTTQQTQGGDSFASRFAAVGTLKSNQAQLSTKEQETLQAQLGKQFASQLEDTTPADWTTSGGLPPDASATQKEGLTPSQQFIQAKTPEEADAAMARSKTDWSAESAPQPTPTSTPAQAWQAITPSAEQKKETAEVWDKVDRGEKQVAPPIKFTGRGEDPTNRAITNPTGSNFESKNPGGGDNGYGDGNNDADQLGICSV